MGHRHSRLCVPRLTAFAAVVVTLVSFITPSARAQVASLVWTAPGDDAKSGRATSYQMRYSRTPVGLDTLAWWNATATTLPVPNMPVPSLAGATDSVKVALGAWNMTYYFLLMTCDEVPNCSGWSNVAVKITGPPTDILPPGTIADLRAK